MTTARGVALYALAVGMATALFLLVPQVDLSASALFYDPHHGFTLRDWEPLSLVYHTIPLITWGIVAVTAAGAAWLFLMQRPMWRLDRKVLLFVALSTALGPGLLANTVFKDHWGRARPTQIEAFGGAHHFTPAPLPAAECRRNCSFVSGHAALGFSLVAFAFLLPPGTTRRRGIAAALGFGALVGLVRVAQGGHFLSDVVWAGLLVFGVAAVLHWWIVEQDGFAAPVSIRLSRQLGCVGTALAARLRASEMARIAFAVVLTAILVIVSMAFFDRTVDLYLHAEDPDLHGLFELTGRLGEAWGWLVLFGLGFVSLHWGGDLPRLRGAAARLRVLSAIPAFLFTAVALSGLVVDLMKIGFGRMRPKLLFRGDLYGFTWLAWRPDHWSFPSGHTATIVALATALWWLWPRHLLFYILVAAIVAASRIVVGAHYPSDVIAGALIAVLCVRGIVWLFANWGIDIEAARRSSSDFADIPPWPCRRFAELSARRRARAGADAGRPLASAASGVVSARYGAADRDLQ
jgi:lipid A 4'-phosphatase